MFGLRLKWLIDSYELKRDGEIKKKLEDDGDRKKGESKGDSQE